MSITLTNDCADQIKKILKDEDSGTNLRVFVQGGGCSGFEYGFSFDDEADDNDTLIDCGEVKLIVDMQSLEMLKGSEIDYVKSIQGESFSIKNPNAAGGCGCGKSFTPKKDGESGCATSDGTQYNENNMPSESNSGCCGS